MLSLQKAVERLNELREARKDSECAAFAKSYHAKNRHEVIAVHYVSALTRLGVTDISEYARMARLHPGCGFVMASYSEAAFRLGDYKTGFKHCRNRWSLFNMKKTPMSCPEWDGKEECQLLVLMEQGLGEQILWASLFSKIPPAIIGVDPRLVTLFSRSFPHCQFVPLDTLDSYSTADTRHVYAMDLGAVYWDGPNTGPWLVADDKRQIAYRNGLEANFPGKTCVGLSWKSGNAQWGDAKSIPPEDVCPLIDSNAVVIGLQYGDSRVEASLWRTSGRRVYATHGLDLTNDLEGVSAMICALDVVVTCSNTVAHMAGALGKRTILLAGGGFTLWYWGSEGNKTPWYPSIEILRGPPRRSWRELAEQAARMINGEVVAWPLGSL